MDCIQKIAVLLARARHCLPRYIFQRLQNTTVKVHEHTHTWSLAVNSREISVFLTKKICGVLL